MVVNDSSQKSKIGKITDRSPKLKVKLLLITTKETVSNFFFLNLSNNYDILNINQEPLGCVMYTVFLPFTKRD